MFGYFLLDLLVPQLADLPLFDQIMPKRRMPISVFNPLVVTLAYDGLCSFEFACAAEVFGLQRPELEPGWYCFETCGLERRQVRGQYGMRLTADAGLDRIVQAGTVIIPGWKSVDAPVPLRLLNALREAHATGKAVFVDFAASWCKNCEAMDFTVFNQTNVQQRLKDFIVVRYHIRLFLEKLCA